VVFSCPFQGVKILGNTLSGFYIDISKISEVNGMETGSQGSPDPDGQQHIWLWNENVVSVPLP
jgi:hypothetical protein